MTVSKKMSVSQARLGIGAPMRMKRVQTQCGVELLDCGVTTTKPELAPTVPMSCDDEVWVQLYRAHEKSIAFLDLACHLGERVSGHRKHRRIVRFKLDRPPRQSRGFTVFLGFISDPVENIPQDIATGAERVCTREFGIDLAGSFCELDSLDACFLGEFEEGGKCPKIIVVSLKVVGRLALGALDFGALQSRGDCADDAARQPILQVEKIFDLTVKPVRSEIQAGRRVDQLTGNSDSIAGLAHTAFEHVANAQLLTDLFDVDRPALVGQSRMSRDDEKRLRTRQSRNDVLDHTVGKIVLLRIRAQVGEWKDRDRGFVGERERRFRRLGSAVGGRCALGGKRFPDLTHEAEAPAWQGSYQPLLFARIPDRASRTVEAGRQRGIGHAAPLPNGIDEFILAYDALPVADQVIEEIEHQWRN
ncbi:hypothetical protein ABID60_008643 [Bradyrhizobium sp. S3.5.5]